MANNDRQRYDWAAVERDYRTGAYSNRELSRTHGPSEAAIRKRAADGGWSRDLSEQIRQRVREKTNRAAAAEIVQSITDAEIVENAAEVGAAVVKSHQRLIRRAKDLTEKLLDLLEGQMTAGKIKVKVAGGAVVEIDLPLDYVGKTLGNATTSMDRAIRLERQAYGLDEEGSKDPGKSLDELLAEVAPK
ncbi:hypothetical protein [Aquipseudomonas alcaligenes]|uniref:Terminase small subunit n=1 Tax=Aquipseudomonas alcaligenes (strain ATCC 14909 / DSM 50342 / CCUG 1425 / JCM 20561 / NBRC 14159 / NCIMB 9945 / NCTC 10367 / 1577) TaxID=1215092 RepID=U2ZLU5_AQUA1|nr:hypothetical protein [Pseudomonas alcaligenes]GAD62032.1 hypothetical protein PA6_009_00360 [Pseudomonas alcaligenes NBRC 14159]SUD16426.1 putative phage-like protein [Pseudomonas alcaligenes]